MAQFTPYCSWDKSIIFCLVTMLRSIHTCKLYKLLWCHWPHHWRQSCHWDKDVMEAKMSLLEWTVFFSTFITFMYVAWICLFYLTEVKKIYDDMYSKVHSWINGLPARISMKIRQQFGDLPEKDMDFQVSWKPLLINVSYLYQKLIVQLQFDLFFLFPICHERYDSC